MKENDLVQSHILVDDENPAVYCGTYRKYNNGSLYGVWLDLSTFSDAEEFFEVCALLHDDENDPEFMFQDYMNFPDYLYHESMSSDAIEKIIEYANMNDDEKEVLSGYIEVTGNEDATLDDANDAYCGNYDDFEEFAEQMMNECYQIPDYLANYIDYKAFARDLSCDYYHAENGNIYRAC